MPKCVSLIANIKKNGHTVGYDLLIDGATRRLSIPAAIEAVMSSATADCVVVNDRFLRLKRGTLPVIDLSALEAKLSREQIWTLLKELANLLYRKSKGQYKIYIAGGAALMLDGQFRDSTVDVDAVWEDDRFIRECIGKVAEKYASYGIDDSWCNKDFVKSPSYTPAIFTYSKLYYELRGLSIYTADKRLLLCMKLVAGRPKDVKDAKMLVRRFKSDGFVTTKEVIGVWLNQYYTDFGIRAVIKPELLNEVVRN